MPNLPLLVTEMFAYIVYSCFCLFKIKVLYLANDFILWCCQDQKQLHSMMS